METFRGVVNQWEADHMGHMNVQFYAAKFDAAIWQLFGALGMTPEWLRDNSRGMAAVSQTTDYSAELLAGDLVEVHSRVLEITERSIRFQHQMINSATGVTAATTELVGVHIDLQDRTSTPFPDLVGQRAAGLMGAE